MVPVQEKARCKRPHVGFRIGNRLAIDRVAPAFGGRSAADRTDDPVDFAPSDARELADVGDVPVESLGSQQLVDPALLSELERVVADSSCHPTELAQIARELFRSEHHDGDDEKHAQLAESETKHPARVACAMLWGLVLALQAVTPDELVFACGISAPEARKVVSAVHRGRWVSGDAEEVRPRPIPGVRRASMDAVHACGRLESLETCATERSGLDPFVKLALATLDGHRIETVRIPLERAGRFSVCVSSQVGCALGCVFCATGRLGLGRNLASWEIVEQVRAVRQTLRAGERVHGIVFQGMGEPLANLDGVLRAVRVMSDPCALAIDARAITVCTSGLPQGILRLAREAPRVRVAISVGSARPQVRRALMPIEERYPFGQVLLAVEEHARITGLAPLWALTLLAGVNDTVEDADALVEVALRFAARTGIRPRVSVIPYNSIDVPGRDPFHRGDVERFRAALSARGLPAHLRYSGGSDVNAACGQLGRVG